MALRLPPLPRLIGGIVAAVGLVVVISWVQMGKASLWPAVVVPAQTFRLSGAGFEFDNTGER